MANICNDGWLCFVKGESVQVRVTWEDYRDKIVDYAMVKFYALAIVQETKQIWSEEEDFQLEKPKLDVQVISIIILISCIYSQ